MLNLTRYNQHMNSIFDELDKSFNRFLPSTLSLLRNGIVNNDCWLPNIDIKEDDTSYTVMADVPGIAKENIKTSIDQYNNLVIEGKRESEVKEEQKNYICIERQNGSFFRKIPIPGIVDAKDIKAKYQDGVLSITIPKTKENLTKEITLE